MAFSDEVVHKLGNYVYRLIDPRNGETFYVGKGKGNRIFQHANDPANLKFEDDEDEVSVKIQRIREIKKAGLSVIHLIHRHDIPDEAIFEVEAAVIDAFPGLSNVQGGYGSGSKGPMSIDEINDKYALPEIDWEPAEKLILININKLDDRTSVDAIYRQVRLAWRISQQKAENADYVLAVVRGVVVGVFKVHGPWLAATHENFPDQIAEGDDMPGRKGFKGEPAPAHIWEKFVGSRGKRITIDGMKHIQYPIRYWPN
jgi:hypothetical protein